MNLIPEETKYTAKEYCEIQVKFRREFDMKAPGFYLCMEDFVLREGRIFEHFSPREKRYVTRPMKQCFNNAYLTAVASRGKLRYIEGFAYGAVLTVHHAWCIDEDDGIIDTTWRSEDRDVDRGQSYIGVEFPLDYVRLVRERTQHTSVIDNWIEGFPLLMEPFENFSYG